MSIMRAASVAALLAASIAPAYAAQAPDTPFVTGPNMQQLTPSQILVTPLGGTQTTLAALLAGGCSANCTITGNLTLGTGTSNAIINQGGTGPVFQLRLGATTSEFRVANSAGTQLFGVGQSSNVIRSLASLQLQPPSVWSGASLVGNSALWSNSNWSGSYTGPTEFAPFFLGLSGDSVASPQPQGGAGLLIQHFLGGATMTGNRQSLDVQTSMTATSGNVATGTPFSASRFTTTSQVNDNGTALTNVGAKGAIWGSNIVAGLASGATFYSGLTGVEIDVNSNSGSSVYNKQGLIIVSTSPDVNAGANADYAIEIGNQITANTGSTPGWTAGLMFGGLAGHWPINSAGTMIGTDFPSTDLASSMVAGVGIDFSQVTFNTAAIKMPGWTLDAVGNESAKTIQIASALTVAALPTCNAGADGRLSKVTDATAPTYNAALTGGGAVHVPVYCNGTAWVSH